MCARRLRPPQEVEDDSEHNEHRGPEPKTSVASLQLGIRKEPCIHSGTFESNYTPVLVAWAHPCRATSRVGLHYCIPAVSTGMAPCLNGMRRSASEQAMVYVCGRPLDCDLPQSAHTKEPLYFVCEAFGFAVRAPGFVNTHLRFAKVHMAQPWTLTSLYFVCEHPSGQFAAK